MERVPPAFLVPIPGVPGRAGLRCSAQHPPAVLGGKMRRARSMLPISTRV